MRRQMVPEDILSSGLESGRAAASNGARGYIVLGALVRTDSSVLLMCQPEMIDSVGVREAGEGERPMVAFP